MTKKTEDKIDETIDAKLGTSLALSSSEQGSLAVPMNMRDVIDFGKIMAQAGPAIPAAFNNNPGMCIAVIMQAYRWQMDPFAVINKAYIVKTKSGELRLAYEAQLVSAVLNTRAPLESRPHIAFEGKGDGMTATITATIRGEREPRTLTTPPLKSCKKHSPLWETDPEQQLSYYGLRAFARRHFPEVLLGVYTVDEMEPIDLEQGPGGEYVPAERPTRDDFVEPDPEPEQDADETSTETASDAPDMDESETDEDPVAEFISRVNGAHTPADIDAIIDEASETVELDLLGAIHIEAERRREELGAKSPDLFKE